MLDTSNLNIQIQIKPQFLSSNVNYGAYLVFKFCEPVSSSGKQVYVNLRYKMRSETFHTYFATLSDDKWMMVELCRFLNHKEDAHFEVLLESFSTYSRKSRAIFVEGIKFQAIDNVENMNLEAVQSVLESNPDMDYVDELPSNYRQIIKRSKKSVQKMNKRKLSSLLVKGILIDEGEKLFSRSKVNGKTCHMLSAKLVLHDSSNMTLFTWSQSEQCRFNEVAELLSHQVFRIKCKIETLLLTSNTTYSCYLVFKISEKCRGLHYPVKVRNLLHGKNRKIENLYFRSPSPLNIHDAIRVPEQREDGWMEVNVWEFDADNELKKSHVPMDLKLINYEGTMSGLIVNGIEFRPM